MNGDIFDITGSWHETLPPWSTKTNEVQTILKNVVARILENNIAIIEELKHFLKNPTSEIIYVIGNHGLI
jgi:kynurenine formamidase